MQNIAFLLEFDQNHQGQEHQVLQSQYHQLKLIEIWW